MFSECVIALTLSNARSDRCPKIADHFSMKNFQIQSADVPSGGQADTTSEVMTFVDNGADVNDVGYTQNPIASLSATENTSLGKFLSRPTLINTRTWSTSDFVGFSGTTLEPWAAFLNNVVIKNKLNNYAFLRAKLCLKIIINATPFHFGCMRVAYEPSTNALNTGYVSSKIRAGSVQTPLLIPLSQLPGVWLYPADNAGGDLHLPFFKATNWLRLNINADAQTMGTLKYFIAAPLGVASATGSPIITIDTFAWLEDVELSGSTAELTLQSGDKYDGPVSSIASSIASISSSMENLPIIGKFARATTIGSMATAKIASMFGFTNTPVITDIPARIPMCGPQLSSSEIGAPIQKLTLDPKQELSIDPTLHGLDSVDELSIRDIIYHKSIFGLDGWSTTDTVGTVLANIRVSPMLFATLDVLNALLGTAASRVYHTPLSYVGMMFTHWRGDIMFEFQVVCTKFHKGRLKITWDPLGSSGVTALPENVVYTTILDIGENNKACIKVPYHQAYAWLRTRTDVDAENWNLGTLLPVNDLYDNGLLSISVLTPLMSPVTPQNLTLLMSVKGCENFEFANPRSSLGISGSTAPPSFFNVQGADVVDTEATLVNFGDEGAKHPHRYALNFGEQIVSLRTLLHRMSIYDTSFPGSSSATKISVIEKSYSRLPPSFGYDPNGFSTAVPLISGVSAPFNFTPTHPITYVTGMFGAFRGGVNYTANVGNDLYPYVGDIRVVRLTDTTDPNARRGYITSTLNSGVTNSAAVRHFNNTTAYNSGAAGSAFTNTQTSSAISWNQPQMSGVNFNFCDTKYSNYGNAQDQTNLECSKLVVSLKQSGASTVSAVTTITTYAGTGVDYTCLWWLCCPTLDYYTAIPTAI